MSKINVFNAHECLWKKEYDKKKESWPSEGSSGGVEAHTNPCI